MTKWLTMKEAAEYLKMGRSTIYKLLREGNLPAHKVGREWRFDAAELAEPEINAFLTHLAVKEKVAALTQNQALSALLFLYRHVLGRDVDDLGEVIRARKPKRLPVAPAHLAPIR